ncbi:AcaB family transcriptional regulator [Thioalkalivibrio sp. ALE14]|uniref:AcaB family transcriptional regulator n=1 Tax=Thioalkalivibrio sp. ALE14 TaxID=1158168 RepID=UPI00036681E3|nr:AcaB family transcriptional regulator [Thioalkalivibrio sp. ALE14]
MTEETNDFDVPGYDVPTGRPSIALTQDLPLYTNTGLMMMNGRPVVKDGDGRITQHIIVGFYLYERKMRDPWRDAARGNPFGAWWVQRARLAMEQARGPIDEALDEMDRRLLGKGFNLDTFPITDPKDTLQIRIKTGLGLLARDLIKDGDFLEASMLFLRSLGEMPNEEFQQRFKVYRQHMRTALRASIRYHHFPLTVDDIRDRTPDALEAEKRMGPVPEAIFSVSGDACWTGPIVIDSTEMRPKQNAPNTQGDVASV